MKNKMPSKNTLTTKDLDNKDITTTMTTSLAAIDIGSNTVQLLIAKVIDGQIIARDNYIKTTRLGASPQPNSLTAEAIDRTAEAIGQFITLARQAGAESIRIVATSAVRDAANKQEFLAAIKQITDQPVEILTGQEEALMSYRGACSLLSFAPGTPVLDVGGSSTELIYAFNNQDISCTSINIGSVRMKQNNWSDKQMRTIIAQGFIPQGESELAVGVGGTITCTAGVLAGLQTYDRAAIEGAVISTEQLRELLANLLPLTIRERCSYSPLLHKRGEIIEQGLQIWLALADLLNFNKILVCGGGILDGTIADML